jgi:hypothetical protein
LILGDQAGALIKTSTGSVTAAELTRAPACKARRKVRVERYGADFTGYSWMLMLLLLLLSSMKSGFILRMKPLEQPQASRPWG